MNIPFIPRSPEYVALAKQRDDEMIVRTAPTDAVRDARRALVARLVYDEQPWPVGEELQKLL